MGKLFGVLAGILVGLFGAGGGIAALKFLEKTGVEQRRAHASSVCAMFVLSILSALCFGFRGVLDFRAAFAFVPAGLVGCFVGAVLLRRVNGVLLRRLFALLVIAGGVAAFLR